MALKMLVKTAPEIKPHIVKVDTEPVISAVEVLATEYIKLYRLAVERDVKNIMSRMETIRKALAEHANETMEAKKPAIIVCPEGEIEFSPRATDTVVPKPEDLIMHLEEKLGNEAAYSVVKIGITDLRKLLSPVEMQPFIEEKDGPRTVKAVRPV